MNLDTNERILCNVFILTTKWIIWKHRNEVKHNVSKKLCINRLTKRVCSTWWFKPVKYIYWKASLKWIVLKFFSNIASEIDSWISRGREFHSFALNTLKEWSPDRVLVLVSSSLHGSLLDLRLLRGVYGTSSSFRYSGALLQGMAVCVVTRILKLTLWRTGSQCRCCRTGFMWALRGVPLRSRAALFCSTCSRRSDFTAKNNFLKTWKISYIKKKFS